MTVGERINEQAIYTKELVRYVPGIAKGKGKTSHNTKHEHGTSIQITAFPIPP
jgi:hypothetical protein